MASAEPARLVNCEDEFTWQYGTKSWNNWVYRSAPPVPSSPLIRGAAGAGRLIGSPAAENFLAGPGNDMIFGNAKPETPGGNLMVGGAGDDVIDTGDSRSAQDLSHAEEVVRAGSGNDIVNARAKRMDIDCGPGYDIVYMAARTSILVIKNCEETPSMG